MSRVDIRKVLKIFLILAIIFVIYLSLSGIKSRKNLNLKIDFDSDGIDMNFTVFNAQNKKSLEVKCLESKREPAEKKILMKGINAKLFKKGKMDKDLNILADSGYSKDNLMNFYLEKNVCIQAEDFYLKSNSFYLNARTYLTSRDKVGYKTGSVIGTAAKGLRYVMDMESIYLYDSIGLYTINQKVFDYKAEILWLRKSKTTLIFQRKAEIKGHNFFLKSDWIGLKFYPEFKKIKKSFTQSNSYLLMGDREKNNYREVTANKISSFYSTTGILKITKVMDKGDIFVKNGKNSTRIRSNLIVITYDEKGEKIKKIEVLKPGTVETQGTRNIHISAKEMDVDFENGDIKICTALNGVKFRMDNFNGESKSLFYDVKKNRVDLKGENSKVHRKNNVFISDEFFIDTSKKSLISRSNVKSIIQQKKENMLFSKDPIFINSQEVTVASETQKIEYRGRVKLIQGDTEMDAGKLIVDADDILTVGMTSLNFQNKENQIQLSGEDLEFNAKVTYITTKLNGLLKINENSLKSDKLTIQFNKENEIDKIHGLDKVEFIKDNLTGQSKKLLWLFKKELIVFTDSAIIKMKNSGTTKGKELQLFLKTNEIKILSQEEQRAKTIID